MRGKLRTPRAVKPILRRALRRATAAGVTIRPAVVNCISVEAGSVCACVLGCAALLDEKHAEVAERARSSRAEGEDPILRRSFLVAMRTLRISNAQAGKIAEGWDGVRPMFGPRCRSKWRLLGTQLRADFFTPRVP